MHTHQSIESSCKICGKPATRHVGNRDHTSLCQVCAGHINRSAALYPDFIIPTFELTSADVQPGSASITNSELSSTKPTEFRLTTTCSCGRRIDMGGQALGMTIACPDCSEKIILTEDMKKDSVANILRLKNPRSKFEPSRYADLPTERIGELMVEANVITVAQLEEGLSLQQGQGGRLVDNLILLDYLDRNRFEIFLAKLTGIRSIELKNCELKSETIALIPLHFGLGHEVCPIERLGGLLTVGMACPHDVATLHKVEFLTRLKVTAFLCHSNDIVDALKRLHPEQKKLPLCASFRL